MKAKENIPPKSPKEMSVIVIGGRGFVGSAIVEESRQRGYRTVVVDKAAKTAKVDIVIDTTSVDTGYDTFNGHIQGADFLDTAKFPTATFKSTKVRFDGDKPVAIDGDLTIKGVTKPVTLDVTLNGAGEHPMAKKQAIGFSATGTIKRTDFGVGAYAPNVSDDVQLRITTEGTLADAPAADAPAADADKK